MGVKELRTEIIIEAPKSTVWNILTDTASYDDWNPFIHPSQGELIKGGKLKNTMHLPGRKPQTFTPKILEVKPEEEFRWLGSLFFKGLFDGEHYFLLNETEEGHTHLIHGENFSGILVKSVMKSIEDLTLQGFISMNKALKDRAEAQS